MIPVLYQGRPAQAEHIHDDMFRVHQDGKSFLVPDSELRLCGAVPPKVDRLFDDVRAVAIGACWACVFGSAIVALVSLFAWWRS